LLIAYTVDYTRVPTPPMFALYTNRFSNKSTGPLPTYHQKCFMKMGERRREGRCVRERYLLVGEVFHSLGDLSREREEIFLREWFLREERGGVVGRHVGRCAGHHTALRLQVVPQVAQRRVLHHHPQRTPSRAAAQEVDEVTVAADPLQRLHLLQSGVVSCAALTATEAAL
jgi:hypothetical protein